MSYRSNWKTAALLILRGLGTIILGVVLFLAVIYIADVTGGTLLVGGVPIALLFLVGGAVKGIVDIYRGLELLGLGAPLRRIGSLTESILEGPLEKVGYTVLGLLILSGLGLALIVILMVPTAILIVLLASEVSRPGSILGFLPTLFFFVSWGVLWFGSSIYLGCLGWEHCKFHGVLKHVVVVLLIPLLVGLYWIGKGGIFYVKRIRQ